MADLTFLKAFPKPSHEGSEEFSDLLSADAPRTPDKRSNAKTPFEDIDVDETGAMILRAGEISRAKLASESVADGHRNARKQRMI
jgi:hypothetical protein